MTIGSHHDIVADAGTIGYVGMNTYTGMIAQLNLSTCTKKGATLYINMLSAIFKNSPAKESPNYPPVSYIWHSPEGIAQAHNIEPSTAVAYNSNSCFFSSFDPLIIVPLNRSG